MRDTTVKWRANVMTGDGSRGGGWGELVLLVSASVLLLFFDFGARILSTNDEARFPMLARDILARGDWLLPRLDGSIYLNKPPLHAWLIALASWPTGQVTQWSAVLPSLLGAVGIAVATYWIGRRLFGPAAGVVAGMIVVTTHGVFTLARVPMPDVTLCAALTAAMAAFVAAEFDGRRAALVAFYGLVGVAFWTKGPAGLLPLAVVLLYTLVTHGWSGPGRLASPPGLVLLVLFLAPWWLLGAASGGERFLRDVLIQDWLLWYVPTAAKGWRVVTEPVGQALGILLPWSLVLPLAVWSGLRAADPERARRLRFLLVWTGVVFALVSISLQQRMRYYLPLCPPTALLIAAWFVGLKLRYRMAAFACLWVGVAAGLGIWEARDGVRHNAATDLGAISREFRKTPAPLYAVDAPVLVFEFYLEAPVVALPKGPPPASRPPGLGPGYLIIRERGGAPPPPPSVLQVSEGLVAGRRFALLVNR